MQTLNSVLYTSSINLSTILYVLLVINKYFTLRYNNHLNTIINIIIKY